MLLEIQDLTLDCDFVYVTLDGVSSRHWQMRHNLALWRFNMKTWKFVVLILLILGFASCATPTRKSVPENEVEKEKTYRPKRWETPGSLGGFR